MIELTTNFTAQEFLVSAKHPDLAAAMTLSEEEIQRLQWLCLFALEPVRENFQEPVVIHSGKRSPELNTAIGGRVNSQHLACEAVDFHVARIRTFEVYQWMHTQLRWPGQLIGYIDDQFIHVGFPRRGIAPNHVVK